MYTENHLIVLIRYKAQTGKEVDALKVLSELIDKVKSEPFYVSITIHQDASDSTDILLYEQWEDESYYKGEHMKTSHLQQFMKDAVGYFAGPPDISFWKIKSKSVSSEI